MANLGMDSCGSKCLKYFIAIFNFFFFVGGLLLAGFAGYEAFNPSSTLNQMIMSLNAPMLRDGLYILMAVGLFLAMISFFGCWGALGENRCLLITYLTFVLLIFILQMVGIIISLVKYKQIKETMIYDLNHNSSRFGPAYLAAVSALEMKFQCCGVSGPQNYDKVPASCYPTTHNMKRRNASPATAGGSLPSSTAATQLTTSTQASAATITAATTTTTAAAATASASVSTTTDSTAATTTTAAAAATTSAPASTTTASVAATTTTTIATDASVAAPTIATTIEPVPPSSVQTTTTSASSSATPTTMAETTMDLGSPYPNGCEAVIRPYLYAAGGVAIGILLIEIMVMIFTCCLISAIQKGYEIV